MARCKLAAVQVLFVLSIVEYDLRLSVVQTDTNIGALTVTNASRQDMSHFYLSYINLSSACRLPPLKCPAAVLRRR